MPRIAVAIFVVVAVSVSIGINIARYPAVFDSVGATHESLVSNDTKEVSKKAETEGTVAVKTMPAMPDENMAQWDVPLQNGPGSTATEAIPYVASNVNHNNGVSEPMATAEETPREAEQPSPELNEYEARPYHPYTSRPTATSSTLVSSEAPAASTEAPVETSYRESYEKYRKMYERGSSTPENEASGDARSSDSFDAGQTYRDDRRRSGQDSSGYYSPPSDSYNTAPSDSSTRENSNHVSTDTVRSEQENNPRGFWPATVAETFRYRSESSEQPSGSFYDRPSSTPAMNVSSTKVVAPTKSESHAVEVANRPAESNVVYCTENKWQAVTPMAAIRNHYEDTSLKSRLERLPEVRGADALPGALPTQQTIAYPVAE